MGTGRGVCLAAAGLVVALGVAGAVSGKVRTVTESRRELPVAWDVDVVVAGGSSGAVAAAAAAARAGADVALVAPRTYLGDDTAGTLRLWLEPGETPETDLARACFPDPSRPSTPMTVKRALDQALVEAGVRTLFGTFATDLLTDSGGRPAGIVVANRAGRQAIRARIVIDATESATLARRAGATFEEDGPWPPTFTRVVIGGEPRSGQGVTCRTLDAPMVDGKTEAPVHVYTLRLPVEGRDHAAVAEADARARDRTFHSGQLDASDTCFHVPGERLAARAAPVEKWPGAGEVSLDALRPQDVDALYVLGGGAGLAREAAAAMLRPAAFLALGERVGAAAAKGAAARGAPQDVRLRGQGRGTVGGEVREPLAGPRPATRPEATVVAEGRALPVLAEVDVLVIGGGTAGAPAGIGAARAGAETLVVEFLHGLGGVSTLGLIGKYYHGNRVGFTEEIDAGVAELGAAVHVAGKAEWYLRAFRAAGGRVWFGCLGCGALVEDGTVVGAVVATPRGRGIVRAKTVLDATGNADVAAAAGAPCEWTGGAHAAVQGAGLPPRALGPKRSYTNTDYFFVDETDAVDVAHLLVSARATYRRAYDLAQCVDTRERRRVVGEVRVSPMDILMGRTWPDTVCIAKSNFDSHGYTVHPLFLLDPPDRAGLSAHVPFRCMVPKGLGGLLVLGLGMSAHRDAMPVLRMQPDVQNQGYAAGVAAAMAYRGGTDVRAIDVRALQKHLVEKRILPPEVLGMKDSCPVSPEKVAEAVAALARDYEELAVVLAHEDVAMPLLRKAYAGAADADARFIYAHVLGMLGDATGAGTLRERVRAADGWDEGWNYRGMGQYGASLSRLDSTLIALGRTRTPEAVEPILRLAERLDKDQAFSHHRAVAMACETLGDPRAAPVLAAVLSKPGMAGHAAHTQAAVREQLGAGGAETAPRNVALRELVLARALYRCGDHEGLGRRLLDAYAKDLRGHYAGHAGAVLAGE